MREEAPAVQNVARAVLDFVNATLGARSGVVARLEVRDYHEGVWRVEVEVRLKEPAAPVPSAEDAPALECRVYLVRLDSGLNVLAYELRRLVLCRGGGALRPEEER